VELSSFEKNATITYPVTGLSTERQGDKRITKFNNDPQTPSLQETIKLTALGKVAAYTSTSPTAGGTLGTYSAFTKYLDGGSLNQRFPKTGIPRGTHPKNSRDNVATTVTEYDAPDPQTGWAKGNIVKDGNKSISTEIVYDPLPAGADFVLPEGIVDETIHRLNGQITQREAGAFTATEGGFTLESTVSSAGGTSLPSQSIAVDGSTITASGLHGDTVSEFTPGTGFGGDSTTTSPASFKQTSTSKANRIGVTTESRNTVDSHLVGGYEVTDTDPFGRPISTVSLVNPELVHETIYHPTKPWLVQKRTGPGLNVTYTYHDSGRLKRTDDSITGAWSAIDRFDASGNVLVSSSGSKPSATPHSVENTYDGAGRLVKSIQKIGGTVIGDPEWQYAGDTVNIRRTDDTSFKQSSPFLGGSETSPGDALEHGSSHSAPAFDGPDHIKTASAVGAKGPRSESTSHVLGLESTYKAHGLAPVTTKVNPDTGWLDSITQNGRTILEKHPNDDPYKVVRGLDVNQDGNLDGNDRAVESTSAVIAEGTLSVTRLLDSDLLPSWSFISADGKTSEAYSGNDKRKVTTSSGTPDHNGAWTDSTTFPDGREVQYKYVANRLDRVQEIRGGGAPFRETQYNYDPDEGYLKSTWDSATGVTTEYDYDNLLRVEAVKQSNGLPDTEYTYYDKTDRIKTVTHVDGETVIDRKPNGTPTGTSGGGLYSTKNDTVLGEHEKLTTRRQGKDVDTVWNHEEYTSRIASKSIAGQVTERFVYSPEGLVDEFHQDPCSRHVKYVRDPVTHDLTEVQYHGGTGVTPDQYFSQHTKDGWPKVVGVDGGVELARTRNGFGEVDSLTVSGISPSLPGNFTVNHFLGEETGYDQGFDANLPGGNRVQVRSYNDLNRLDSLTDGELKAEYTWYPGTDIMQSRSLRRNGQIVATTAQEVDLATGRLQSIVHTGNGGATLSSHHYTYYPGSSRIHTITREDGEVWTYRYDDEHYHLTDAIRTGPGEPRHYRYEYDEIGNRVAEEMVNLPGSRIVFSQNDANMQLRQDRLGNILLTGEYTGSHQDLELVVQVIGTNEANAEISVTGTVFGAEWHALLPTGGLPFHTNIPVEVIASFTDTNGEECVNLDTGEVYLVPPVTVRSHSCNGELTADADQTYEWDANGQLIGVKKMQGFKWHRETYTYYPDGQRASRTVYKNPARVDSPTSWQKVAVHSFVWNGWELLHETVHNSSGQLEKSLRYIWGPDLVGQSSGGHNPEGAGGVGGLLAVIDTPAAGGVPRTLLPLTDHLGTTHLLLNPATGATTRFRYAPFGEPLARDAATAGDADPDEVFAHLYSTKPWNADTGLYYYGYRYYHPRSGRWISRDPIAEDGGLNLFGFCSNDPVNKYDILGMEFIAVETRKVKIPGAENLFNHASIAIYEGEKPVGENFDPGNLSKKLIERIELITFTKDYFVKLNKLEVIPIVEINLLGKRRKGIEGEVLEFKIKETRKGLPISVILSSIDPKDKPFIISEPSKAVVIHSESENIREKWTGRIIKQESGELWKNKLKPFSENYKYAEDVAGVKPLARWPNSLYGYPVEELSSMVVDLPIKTVWPTKNNSNTFIREMMKQAGTQLTLEETFPGDLHPGGRNAEKLLPGFESPTPFHNGLEKGNEKAGTLRLPIIGKLIQRKARKTLKDDIKDNTNVPLVVRHFVIGPVLEKILPSD